ncbi:MAG: M23 family metallopeptidase [Elusimicrobiota bacterium]
MAALALWATAAGVDALEIRVEPRAPRPGDVVRVEVLGVDNPGRVSCLFRSKSYPLYAVGPGRMRALIGLEAVEEPGRFALEVTRRPFLLPEETKTVNITVAAREFGHRELRMPKKKAALPKKPEAEDAIRTIRAALRTETARQLWEGAFLRPAQGRLTSAYGHSRNVNRKKWSWHKGVDIAAPEGHQVAAPNAAKVALAGRYPVQGGTVILDHGQGVMSAFLHLRSSEVEAGDEVPKGRTIGAIGGGGFSTGTHLHWGVYVHGAAVDPEQWLRRRF